ncbi:putative Cilia- and flagella-associated protein 46 [Paratrimastix pyriformis]|uniref:Cilia- and flagella-associated protein 46 n=1 Tax=Paratrimastix pyriformis TaxID=342808 RepID=A0ABQ8UUN6_9EUKA|nr:putative Cilia- and flagella-associated protein 46 [Paratrimastix pyriformis]
MEGYMQLLNDLTDKNAAETFSKFRFREGEFPLQLFVLFGETAWKLGCTDVAKESLERYIHALPSPPRDQYLARAHFALGEIISMEGQLLKGKAQTARVVDGTTEIIKGLTIALEKGPRYAFLVSNASFHLMRAARPLMRAGHRQVLVGPLEQTEKALQGLPDAEVDPTAAPPPPPPDPMTRGHDPFPVPIQGGPGAPTNMQGGMPWRAEVMIASSQPYLVCHHRLTDPHSHDPPPTHIPRELSRAYFEAGRPEDATRMAQQAAQLAVRYEQQRLQAAIAAAAPAAAAPAAPQQAPSPAGKAPAKPATKAAAPSKPAAPSPIPGDAAKRPAAGPAITGVADLGESVLALTSSRALQVRVDVLAGPAGAEIPDMGPIADALNPAGAPATGKGPRTPPPLKGLRAALHLQRVASGRLRFGAASPWAALPPLPGSAAPTPAPASGKGPTAAAAAAAAAAGTAGPTFSAALGEVEGELREILALAGFPLEAAGLPLPAPNPVAAPDPAAPRPLFAALTPLYRATLMAAQQGMERLEQERDRERLAPPPAPAAAPTAAPAASPGSAGAKPPKPGGGRPPSAGKSRPEASPTPAGCAAGASAPVAAAAAPSGPVAVVEAPRCGWDVVAGVCRVAQWCGLVDLAQALARMDAIAADRFVCSIAGSKAPLSARVGAEYVQATLLVRRLGDSAERLTRPMVDTRKAALRKLEGALESALRTGPLAPALVEEGCTLIFNTALPLLQPNLRQHVHHALQAAVAALERVGSLHHELHALLLHEAARCDVEADFLKTALTNVTEAYGLDYTATGAAEGRYGGRAFDRLLEPLLTEVALRTDIHRAPERPEEQAVLLLARARATKDPLVLAALVDQVRPRHPLPTLVPPSPRADSAYGGWLLADCDHHRAPWRVVQTCATLERVEAKKGQVPAGCAALWGAVMKVAWKGRLVEPTQRACDVVLAQKLRPEGAARDLVVLQAEAWLTRGETFVAQGHPIEAMGPFISGIRLAAELGEGCEWIVAQGATLILNYSRDLRMGHSYAPLADALRVACEGLQAILVRPAQQAAQAFAQRFPPGAPGGPAEKTPAGKRPPSPKGGAAKEAPSAGGRHLPDWSQASLGMTARTGRGSVATATPSRAATGAAGPQGAEGDDEEGDAGRLTDAQLARPHLEVFRKMCATLAEGPPDQAPEVADAELTEADPIGPPDGDPARFGAPEGPAPTNPAGAASSAPAGGEWQAAGRLPPGALLAEGLSVADAVLAHCHRMAVTWPWAFAPTQLGTLRDLAASRARMARIRRTVAAQWGEAAAGPEPAVPGSSGSSKGAAPATGGPAVAAAKGGKQPAAAGAAAAGAEAGSEMPPEVQAPCAQLGAYMILELLELPGLTPETAAPLVSRAVELATACEAPEVWASLAELALRHGQPRAALQCAKQVPDAQAPLPAPAPAPENVGPGLAQDALQLAAFESAAQRGPGEAPARKRLALLMGHIPTDRFAHWAAVARLAQGQAIASFVKEGLDPSQAVQTRLEAMGQLATAAEHAVPIRAARLCLLAARLLYNTACPLAAQAHHRPHLRPLTGAVLDHVFTLARAMARKRRPGEQAAPGEASGGLLYDDWLAALTQEDCTTLIGLYKMHFRCLEQERLWAQGLKSSEEALLVLPAASHGPLWGARVSFLKRMGRPAEGEMLKVKSLQPPLQSQARRCRHASPPPPPPSPPAFADDDGD